MIEERRVPQEAQEVEGGDAGVHQGIHRSSFPIELGAPLEITAKIVRRDETLFEVEAKLTQGGQLKTKATAELHPARR